ncbi:MAG: hypothetical protein HZB56_13645 [Deltaproteobacteria bacterium]|nr:hypothetical protein [Deltaproteobacteria bacterium]
MPAAPRRARRSPPLALLLVLAASASGGCRGCGAPQPPGGGTGADQATPARVPPGEKAVPLTPEALAPVIRERALPGELPDRIVVELAREAAPEGMVGRASPGTRLSVTPPLQGVAVWESPSTLSWKPATPFAHATRYQVALERLETRDGPVSGRDWSASFETPRFGLARVALDRLTAGKAEVAVVFSGAVSAEAVAPFLSWELDGERLDGVRLSGAERPHVVRAALSLRRTRPGATIRASLREGAPGLARGAVAPAGSGEVVLPSGPAVTVHGAYLREGTSGFYVDVVCDDPAAGGRRWHWDRESSRSWQLSRRCVLAADELARTVRTSPPVKLSVAPGAGGFRLFGDFARGPLTLTIEAGARTEDGGELHRTHEAAFSVPSRRPAVSFAASGRYLPRSAWKSLPVAHTNLDQAQLSVRRIAPENLVFWLSDDGDERATERTSDLLLEKKVPLRGPQDRQATTWVDVAGLLPSTTRGVLELTLAAHGQRTSARLLLTQMSLVAKRGAAPRGEGWRQEVWAWALDMDTAEGLPGVELSLVRKSGKVLGRCTTGGDGGCRIPAARDDADDAAPFALLARKGDDLTYIRWADLKTDTSDAEVSGEPYAAEAAYRAALWTERGVYRPGEVAHAAAVLRDREHRAPPAGMPVELQLLDPRGKVARKLQVKPNEAGLLAVDLPFAAFADTGRWQLVALVGDRRVGAHAFNVEEFVPERMKVTAAADRAAYRLGEAAGVAVDARYLFGGSAEGASVELTCALEPAAFRPAKENQQLTYGPRPGKRAARALSLGSAQGTLDKKGHADLACPPGPGAFAGPARLVATAAVFEGGSGRSTVQQATAPVHPERFYVGLQSGAARAEAGKPIAVKGLVVGWDGAVAPGAAREVAVELLRLEPEYGWWWDEEGGGERFERHLRPVSEGTTRVAVADGRFALDLVPQGSGAAWLVRARAGQALTELEIPGDGGGWYWSEGDRREQTPRPQKATSLALELPPAVKVGQPATVQVAIPFRGRALLTVETDRVVSAEWRKVEPGVQRFPFEVKELTPNVYVSVLLLKDPHLESAQAFLPDRAFGVASAAVEPTALTAPLQLSAPAEVRSASPLTVKLDVGRTEGPTWALVAAVDEGILQLTRMKSPDPLGTLFARRALGVDTFETIGWSMLLPPQGPSRTTGGDAGSGAAGRVQPVKPVALWSGLVPVSPDGKAEVRFQVPQYRGQLRVMAVTVGPRRLGKASASVTVKDPIVLSTTLPRFVTHGDQLQIPVFVTNLSGAPQEVKVALQAEPLPVPGMAPAPSAAAPLSFVGRSEGTARLADGASGTLVFQVKAALAVGAARLRVVARAGPHESREELDVPFLPAGPRERFTRRLEVAEGTLDLAPHLRGWVPTSERTTVWLTANPYGESFDHLKFLLHYPYGCVEQTTSSTRPLLFVGNLVESVDPAFTAGGKLEEMVLAGVARLLSMQTPSGGLSYWPGATEPYAWGTAYATHLLLDAQKAGFAVPQDRLDEILRWIEGEAARRERGERDRGGIHEGPSAEAYLHYVLALAGKGQKGRLQQLLDQLPARRDGEALERQYMLQAALYLAGDRRYEKELRSPDVSPVSDERKSGWSFYSDRRRRGFVLSTFQDLFGNDPAGEPLAQRVADGLRQPSGSYNTQEIVWGVTGLGKRVGAVARDFKPGKLLADGKAVEPRPVAGRSADRTWALARASEYRSLRLEVAGKGQGGPLYAILSSEGVRERPELRTGGNGLSVTRTWRRLDGTALDLAAGELPLAGLAFVELTLRNLSGERVENVALVDRIPAGFEIENPRLGRGQVASWVEEDQLWVPDFLDVRDHQLALFGKLEAGQARKVVYAVRAVTAGQFTVPPVEAEAMYDPRLWARQPGTTARVAGPWKADLL